MHLLSISKVDSSEERVVLRTGFARLVLVQEHRRASHFQAELLDALFIVHRQQEGLAALVRLHRGQDGKVLREGITWQDGSDGGSDGRERERERKVIKSSNTSSSQEECVGDVAIVSLFYETDCDLCCQEGVLCLYC